MVQRTGIRGSIAHSQRALQSETRHNGSDVIKQLIDGFVDSGAARRNHERRGTGSDGHPRGSQKQPRKRINALRGGFVPKGCSAKKAVRRVCQQTAFRPKSKAAAPRGSLTIAASSSSGRERRYVCFKTTVSSGA
eukprot:4648372-Prymnesium_polylepis.1